MDEIIKMISQHGVGVLVTGLITCILIGIIKTPIKQKVIKSGLSEESKVKRGNIFDIIVFVSTYLIAFLGALAYSSIMAKGFSIKQTLICWIPVWTCQSVCFGIWKKLGLKRGLSLLLKVFVKDLNGDGEVSLDEAVSQVKEAFKNGKLDTAKLLNDLGENASKNLPGVLNEAYGESKEVLPEVVKVENQDKVIDIKD